MGGVHQDQRRLVREQEGEVAADAARDRYRKQSRFAPLGVDGQARLGRSSVLLVGVGALGSHVASSLVRAGVGRMWVVDRDVVELDNLQRQVLFTEADARDGRPKAVAAVERLRAVNADCALHAVADDFGPAAFERLCRDAGGSPDVIVDGTDNFATRHVINDLAARDGVDWVYGGVLGAEGSAMVVRPGRGPCLRCVMPEPAPGGEAGNCETAGVLQPAVAAVAAFQSAQVLKLLAGRDEAVARGVYTVDVWRDRYAMLLASSGPSPDCPVCAHGRFPALEVGEVEPARLCGREVVQVQPRRGAVVDLGRLAGTLADVVTDVARTPHLLRFSAEGCRFSVFPGGRALVFGTADTGRARILYDRYVGAC